MDDAWHKSYSFTQKTNTMTQYYRMGRNIMTQDFVVARRLLARAFCVHLETSRTKDLIVLVRNAICILRINKRLTFLSMYTITTFIHALCNFQIVSRLLHHFVFAILIPFCIIAYKIKKVLEKHLNIATNWWQIRENKQGIGNIANTNKWDKIFFVLHCIVGIVCLCGWGKNLPFSGIVNFGVTAFWNQK